MGITIMILGATVAHRDGANDSIKIVMELWSKDDNSSQELDRCVSLLD